MFPAPYGPPHIVVALCCLALSIGVLPTVSRQFLLVPLREMPNHLVGQFASDVRAAGSWRTIWVGLLAWGAAVAVLHFGGLAWERYSRLWWWDLLTHFLSGVGVGAILLVGLREVTPAEPPAAWAVLALASVSAGFEVYEYVFRSFWHSWTLWTYAFDTATDLLYGCLGSLLAIEWYRSRIDVDAASETEVGVGVDTAPTEPSGRPRSND